MIKIALVGFGTVGQSFLEILINKRGLVEELVGKVKVVAIADSKSSISGDFKLNYALDYKRGKGKLPENRSASEIVENDDFDVLVEATHTKLDGGDGLRYIKTALKRGRHVVTSNKGPLVVAFHELIKLAEKNDVRLMYEATVGGAMPVIRIARKYLASCKILGAIGILNGTCNYILSRMEDERMPYTQVLKEAQELGIAEPDPSFDVDGIDAAIKLVILSNTIGIKTRFEDVEIEGITRISPEAFEVASQKGYTIRLIAESKKECIRVAPRLVPLSHPMAIKGTMNAVMFKTDTAGEIFLAGRGAGGYETATAMLSDLMEIYARGN